MATAMTLRGTARCFLAQPGWKDDVEHALAMVREAEPQMRALIMLYSYGLLVAIGVLVFDDGSVRQTVEMLEIAERSGEDFTLAVARFVRGLALLHSDAASRVEGFDLLTQARDAVVRQQLTMPILPVIELECARDKARDGDLDGAIESARTLVEQEYDSGELPLRGAAVTALVESLLARGDDADIQEAQAAIDRLAAVPTEPGFVVLEVTLLGLRALLARARGDDAGYRDLAGRYRGLATSLGFDGHLAAAQAMT